MHNKIRKIRKNNRHSDQSAPIDLAAVLYWQKIANGVLASAVMASFFFFLIALPPRHIKTHAYNDEYRGNLPEIATIAQTQKLATLNPPQKSKLHNEIMKIVKGSPMEEMVDEIAQKDRPVAAFIVGIAMKESKFGKYSPKKDGKECYNYWGYRGKENTTRSGYSCFDSPEHAISVVGGTIERIVKKGVRTPAQMISWKCGSTCAGHDPYSVQKWISDVEINYYKLNPPTKEIAKR